MKYLFVIVFAFFAKAAYAWNDFVEDQAGVRNLIATYLARDPGFDINLVTPIRIWERDLLSQVICSYSLSNPPKWFFVSRIFHENGRVYYITLFGGLKNTEAEARTEALVYRESELGFTETWIDLTSITLNMFPQWQESTDIIDSMVKPLKCWELEKEKKEIVVYYMQVQQSKRFTFGAVQFSSDGENLRRFITNRSEQLYNSLIEVEERIFQYVSSSEAFTYHVWVPVGALSDKKYWYLPDQQEIDQVSTTIPDIAASGWTALYNRETRAPLPYPTPICVEVKLVSPDQFLTIFELRIASSHTEFIFAALTLKGGNEIGEVNHVGSPVGNQGLARQAAVDHLSAILPFSRDWKTPQNCTPDELESLGQVLEQAKAKALWIGVTASIDLVKARNILGADRRRVVIYKNSATGEALFITWKTVFPKEVKGQTNNSSGGDVPMEDAGSSSKHCEPNADILNSVQKDSELVVLHVSYVFTAVDNAQEGFALYLKSPFAFTEHEFINYRGILQTFSLRRFDEVTLGRYAVELQKWTNRPPDGKWIMGPAIVPITQKSLATQEITYSFVGASEQNNLFQGLMRFKNSKFTGLEIRDIDNSNPQLLETAMQINIVNYVS